MTEPGWADLHAWQIDRDNGTPLFRQLYLQVRGAILSQSLPPGRKLPSTRALAARLGLARASVVSAYEQLLAEGYLSGKIGSGTYISSDLPEPIEGRPPHRRAAPPTRRPRLSRCARTLQDVVESTAESDVRPFAMGRCRVDRRTVEAWGALSHRAARSLGPVHLGYTDARGLLDLRHEIADYLRATRSVRCDPEQVVITSGALAAAGVRLRPIAVDAQGLNVRAGIRSAPRARAAFVTPSHQFPLAVVLSMARRLELLAWARETGAWIVEDNGGRRVHASGIFRGPHPADASRVS